MKHSKIILAAAVLCLTGAITKAQSISKSVVAVNGGSFSGSGILVDWTIGQAVTSYTSSSSLKVTEGFHPIEEKSIVTATPTVRNATNALQVKAYPNPVSSVLHISVLQSTADPLDIRVTDLMGKTIKTVDLDGELSTNTDVDLSALTGGMYYITVNAGKENAQVMKIVKN